MVHLLASEFLPGPLVICLFQTLSSLSHNFYPALDPRFFVNFMPLHSLVIRISLPPADCPYPIQVKIEI